MRVFLLSLLVGVLLLAARVEFRAVAVSPPQASRVKSGPHPIVLELFTSEGCSSCPPADALLRRLDDAGNLDGVEVIAIEEHVDYWDRLGWRDPFSSEKWTARQEHYAEAFRRDGVYTPQLVVGGRRELVGSAEHQVQGAVAEVAKEPNAKLEIEAVQSLPDGVELSLSAREIPAGSRKPELWVAVTERGLTSDVLRGENEGRNLAHAAVLRSLARVATVPEGGSPGISTRARTPLDRTWKRENLRFVVFLQEANSLHILGAAAAGIAR